MLEVEHIRWKRKETLKESGRKRIRRLNNDGIRVAKVKDPEENHT